MTIQSTAAAHKALTDFQGRIAARPDAEKVKAAEDAMEKAGSIATINELFFDEGNGDQEEMERDYDKAKDAYERALAAFEAAHPGMTPRIALMPL